MCIVIVAIQSLFANVRPPLQCTYLHTDTPSRWSPAVPGPGGGDLVPGPGGCDRTIAETKALPLAGSLGKTSRPRASRRPSHLPSGGSCLGSPRTGNCLQIFRHLSCFLFWKSLDVLSLKVFLPWLAIVQHSSPTGSYLALLSEKLGWYPGLGSATLWPPLTCFKDLLDQQF